MNQKDEKAKVFSATSVEGETQVLVCKPQTGKEDTTCKPLQLNLPQNGQGTGTEASTKPGQDQASADNNLYNLMEQLVTEKQSLWHIRNYYKDDASSDQELMQLWDFVETEKADLIKLLSQRLKERLGS